jgi:cytoskeletal protein CcmA (bactofilin family)
MCSKHTLAGIIGFLAIFLPLSVSAAVFLGEENVVVKEPVLDNLYVASGNPVIAADVQGDLFIAGGNVDVSGHIMGDLGAAGGTVNITGNVDGDVRVFGGTLFINSEIGGEVISFGGEVTYGPKAKVGKDLIAGSDNLKIDPAAVVTGKKTIFENPEKDKIQQRMAERANPWLTGAFWFSLIYTIAVYLLVAAVLMGAFPNIVKKYAQTAKGKGGTFWKHFGIGLLGVFVFPLSALLLLFTGIGSLLGGILLVLWLMYFLLAFVVAGFLLGMVAKQLFTKQNTDLDWYWGLGGVAALPLLSSLPFVGWAVGLVFFVWAMGTMMDGDLHTFRSAK